MDETDANLPPDTKAVLSRAEHLAEAAPAKFDEIDILRTLLGLEGALEEVFPSCRERSLAVTKIQEARFWLEELRARASEEKFEK